MALAIAGLGLAMPAWAQEALSLAEAVRRAEANHPAIRAAERAIDAARAREAQVVAPPNPNLSLVVDQVPIPDPVGGNYMAGVTQPLLLGGQRAAQFRPDRIDAGLVDLLDLHLAQQMGAAAQVQPQIDQTGGQPVRPAIDRRLQFGRGDAGGRDLGPGIIMRLDAGVKGVGHRI
ncbi:MAG: TolC family protein [Candidatus Sericytochromatia bacterium]